MESLANFLKLRIGDVGVNLRRRDVLVPQQFLDRAQIRAVTQKIGGKGVSQPMRRDFNKEFGFFHILLDTSLDASRGQSDGFARCIIGIRRLAAIADKHRPQIIFAGSKILAKPIRRPVREEYNARPSPFPYNAKLTSVEVDLISIKIHELR